MIRTRLSSDRAPLRLLNIGFGAVLVVTPFAYGAGAMQVIANLGAGAALILLSFRRGPVRNRYGAWSKFLI